MKSLLPTFLILDIARAGDLPDITLPENSCLAYSVSGESLHAVSSIYKDLFSPKNRHTFCLSIKADVADIGELADLIVTATFHHHYQKIDFGVPVLLFESGEADPGKTISACQGVLLDQGYSGVECMTMNAHEVLSWSGKEKKGFRQIMQHNDMNDLTQAYSKAISMTDGYDLSFFFDLSDPSELPELIKSLGKADARACQDHPRMWSLLQATQHQLAIQRELRFTIGLLRQRLGSQNSYHSFYNPAAGQVRKQITEITDFYKYEYEILPLWYKRLGHIIKVLMGKRTFKSLFSDRVKKYKA